MERKTESHVHVTHSHNLLFYLCHCPNLPPDSASLAHPDENVTLSTALMSTLHWAYSRQWPASLFLLFVVTSNGTIWLSVVVVSYKLNPMVYLCACDDLLIIQGSPSK